MRPRLALAAAAVLVIPSASDLGTAAKPHPVFIHVTTVSGTPTSFRAYATSGSGSALRLHGDVALVEGGFPAAVRGDRGTAPPFRGWATTPVNLTADMTSGEIVFETRDGATELRVDVLSSPTDSSAKRVTGEGARIVVRRVGNAMTIGTR